VTPGMQVCLKYEVKLLHVRNEQVAQLKLLKHNCIPATVVMTRHSERALPGMENGKSQSCNRPAPAILLALHFLCMHDSGHMRSCICKASWGEQGTRRVHTTLLRAELPGSIGIGDHAICE
jgi:hypothetical protein